MALRFIQHPVLFIEVISHLHNKSPAFSPGSSSLRSLISCPHTPGNHYPIKKNYRFHDHCRNSNSEQLRIFRCPIPQIEQLTCYVAKGCNRKHTVAQPHGFRRLINKDKQHKCQRREHISLMHVHRKREHSQNNK